MNNKSAIIGGVLLLLAALAALVPYFAGIKAEASLRADHEILANEMAVPGLTIALDSYQRGYLASEAVTAITFTSGTENAQPLRFELHHHINHFPSLSHNAIASATSELVLPPELQSFTKPFLNGRPLPVTINTYIGLTGVETAMLSSPAFKAAIEEDGISIEWQGLKGNSTRTSNASHLTGDLSLPGLRYNSSAGTLALRDLSYSADMNLGSHEMWFGTARASLKSLHIGDASESSTISLTDVHIASDQLERGAVTDTSVTIELGKSTLGEVALDSAIYDMEVRNLDTQTVADIQQAMRDASNSGDESQLGMALLEAIPALLKAQPEFNIRNLHFKSSLGNFDGNLHIAFNGEWNDAMMENPLGILAMLKADVDMAMSKSLLLTLGQSQMHATVAAMAEMQGDELSDEELDAMARERAAQKLELLAANDYLLEKGDLYTSKIHFESGQLTINGKPANEFFGEAAQEVAP